MRTSETHPLRIDMIILPGDGKAGLSLCPGKKQPVSMTGGWNRDLETDLRAIKDWGASLVVTLLEEKELHELAVPDLGGRVAAHGMGWVWLPIANDAVPDDMFITAFRKNQPRLSASLAKGENIFIHCMGGIGRTSMIAALLLLHAGFGASNAIAAVHRARAQSFSAPGQEDFIRHYERRFMARPFIPPPKSPI